MRRAVPASSIPPRAAAPREVDVAVVGGGLLGLSTALELAELGRDVVVLEAGSVGCGQSGRSGGQLWPGPGVALSTLVERFGEKAALRSWELMHEALAVVHQRAAQAGGCGFRPGLLLVSRTRAQQRRVAGEARLLERLGIAWGRYVPGDELRRRYLASPRYRDALLLCGDEPGHQYGHLDALAFTRALARLAGAAGATLCEQRRVSRVHRLPGGGFELQAGGLRLRAAQVVLATGAETLPGAPLPRCFVPATTLILYTEALHAREAAALLPTDAAFCDASTTAMHYARLVDAGLGDGSRRLAFGGADALAQLQLAWSLRAIRREMFAVFPQLRGCRVETIRSGRCDLGRDGLPMLLEPLPGLYSASGFSGHGMVATTAYATAIAQGLSGRSRARFDAWSAFNSRPYASNRLLALGQAACSSLLATRR